LSVALFALIATCLSAPVPEEEMLEQGAVPRFIPTFESVDWVRSQYSGKCYDASSEQSVKMGQSFFIGCGKCTCDRYGYWCVTKCPPVYFDSSNCVEVESYIEGGCCKRKRCANGVTHPAPTTESITSKAFTTADAFSTEAGTDDAFSTDADAVSDSTTDSASTEPETETAGESTEGTDFETIPPTEFETIATEGAFQPKNMVHQLSRSTQRTSVPRWMRPLILLPL